MGGNVNVFIRESNGTFHKMTRWTNSLPSYVNFLGVTNEQEHFDEYMQSWFEMRDDWKENRKTKKFEFPMTPVYFPAPNKICRSEYGLVFVDYITKTVYSAQDYTDIGSIYLASIMLEKNNKEYMDMLKNLIVSGKISLKEWNSTLKKYKFVKKITSIQEILDVSENFLKMPDKRFRIDNSPWTYSHCMTHNKSFEQIKEDIDKIIGP